MDDEDFQGFRYKASDQETQERQEVSGADKSRKVQRPCQQVQ